MIKSFMMARFFTLSFLPLPIRFPDNNFVENRAIMAYNEQLTNRLREALADLPNVEEKRMFSGITFMINGKMCISAGNDRLMCRIDPAIHEEVVERNGVQTVMMKGRE